MKKFINLSIATNCAGNPLSTRAIRTLKTHDDCDTKPNKMAPPIAKRESETESFALVEMRGKRFKCLSSRMRGMWNVNEVD